MPDPDTRPDAADKAADVRGDEFFEFSTQNNANNAKRTYDLYQDFDVQAVRSYHRAAEKWDTLAFQAAQNAIETANMAGKQALKHADVAADALWTDELNPVTRGAGNELTGDAPVNSKLASTASLESAFTNITSQVGILTTQVVGLAQSVIQGNVAITNANAAMVALLAQLVENSKQTSATKPAA